MRSTIMKQVCLFLLFVTGLTGCINFDSNLAPKCELTGKEKFSLYINGAEVGAFERYTYDSHSNSKVNFYNGIITNGYLLVSWYRSMQEGKVTESKKDILISKMGSQSEINDEPWQELIGSELVDISATVSSTDKTCLIVNELNIKTKKIRSFNGIVTP